MGRILVLEVALDLLHADQEDATIAALESQGFHVRRQRLEDVLYECGDTCCNLAVCSCGDCPGCSGGIW